MFSLLLISGDGGDGSCCCCSSVCVAFLNPSEVCRLMIPWGRTLAADSAGIIGRVFLAMLKANRPALLRSNVGGEKMIPGDGALTLTTAFFFSASE